MTIGDAVKTLYKNGMRLRVNFDKLNGDEREMVIKRIPKLESNVIGNPVYKYEDRLPVCEIECPDGSAPRWRTIPLERINFFVCENR